MGPLSCHGPHGLETHGLEYDTMQNAIQIRKTAVKCSSYKADENKID